MSKTNLTKDQEEVFHRVLSNVNTELSNYCESHVRMTHVFAGTLIVIGVVFMILFSGYWVMYGEWPFSPTSFIISGLIISVFDTIFLKFKVAEFEKLFSSKNKYTIKVLKYSINSKLNMGVERLKITIPTGEHITIKVKE